NLVSNQRAVDFDSLRVVVNSAVYRQGSAFRNAIELSSRLKVAVYRVVALLKRRIDGILAHSALYIGEGDYDISVANSLRLVHNGKLLSRAICFTNLEIGFLIVRVRYASSIAGYGHVLLAVHPILCGHSDRTLGSGREDLSRLDVDTIY